MAPDLFRGSLVVKLTLTPGSWGTRSSLNLDPPVDVMPDYENQNQELVW